MKKEFSEVIPSSDKPRKKMRQMEDVGIICVCERKRNRMVVVVVGS